MAGVVGGDGVKEILASTCQVLFNLIGLTPARFNTC